MAWHLMTNHYLFNIIIIMRTLIAVSKSLIKKIAISITSFTSEVFIRFDINQPYDFTRK